MAKLMKRRTFGIKTETAQSSAASLAATDYLNVTEFACTPSIESVPNDYVSTSLGTRPHITGKKSYTLTSQWKLKGSGNAGVTIPPFDAMMLSAGTSGSITAGTRVTYNPVSTSFSTSFQSPARTATVIGNYDGVSHQINGVAGNLKFSLAAGEPAIVDYNGMGLWTSVVDGALPTVQYSSASVNPPIVQSIAFEVGGYQFTADKFEFDMGNQLQLIPDVNSPNGIGYAVIGDRKPVGSFTALMVNVATSDFFGRLENGTVTTGSCTVGTSAGNRYVFSFAGIQFSNVQYTNQNGFIAVQATLAFSETANDAWTLKVE